MQSIAIKPGNTAGVAIKLDYVRLSSVPPNAEKAVTARWAPTTGGVDLYYDTHRDGVNATLIARGIFGTQFAWTLPDLAPNTYYLIARTGNKQSASLPFVVKHTTQGTHSDAEAIRTRQIMPRLWSAMRGICLMRQTLRLRTM